MGETAEVLARQYGITREESDCFALESQRKAEAAIAAGHFAREIAPVTVHRRRKQGVARSSRDEHPRAGHDDRGLRKLPPVFGDVEGQRRHHHRRLLVGHHRRRRGGRAGIGATRRARAA